MVKHEELCEAVPVQCTPQSASHHAASAVVHAARPSAWGPSHSPGKLQEADNQASAACYTLLFQHVHREDERQKQQLHDIDRTL